MAKIFLSLGSNLGNREHSLGLALTRLREMEGIALGAISRFRETEPQGGPAGQGRFLNAVCSLDAQLTPLELLRRLQAIEAEAGRDRSAETERWGPRRLDLDILLWGREVIDLPGLRIPHPLMAVRRFVLEPLAEIAPRVRHPELEQTAAELLLSLTRDDSNCAKRERA